MDKRGVTILKAHLSSHEIDELMDRASPERRERALKYRDKSMIKRTLLGESLLHKALDAEGIERLPMLEDKRKKPYVEARDFYFNISHSEDLVVLAYSKNKVGIDVEYLKERDYSFYKKYFHPREIEFLDRERNILDFYKIWTLKESYIKATGDVLQSFDSFYILPTYESSVQAFFDQKIEDSYIISITEMEDK